MAINKDHSPLWVRITIWVTIVGLIIGFVGIGLLQFIATANTPAPKTPAAPTQPAAKTVAEIEATYTPQIKAMEDGLAKDPTNKDQLVSLGSTYMSWGQELAQSADQNAMALATTKFASSSSAWEKAYKMDPKNKEIGGDYATALFYSGKSTEAIDLARTVLKDNPKYAIVWFNLGMYLSGTDKTGATTAFENAIKFDTTGQYKTVAQQNIDALKAGK